MKKTFFVFAIRYVSTKTLKAETYFSTCVHNTSLEASEVMSSVIDGFHRDGCVIVMARVFRKSIKL